MASTHRFSVLFGLGVDLVLLPVTWCCVLLLWTISINDPLSLLSSFLQGLNILPCLAFNQEISYLSLSSNKLPSNHYTFLAGWPHNGWHFKTETIAGALIKQQVYKRWKAWTDSLNHTNVLDFALECLCREVHALWPSQAEVYFTSINLKQCS